MATWDEDAAHRLAIQVCTSGFQLITSPLRREYAANYKSYFTIINAIFILKCILKEKSSLTLTSTST